MDQFDIVELISSYLEYYELPKLRNMNKFLYDAVILKNPLPLIINIDVNIGGSLQIVEKFSVPILKPTNYWPISYNIRLMSPHIVVSPTEILFLGSFTGKNKHLKEKIEEIEQMRLAAERHVYL